MRSIIAQVARRLNNRAAVGEDRGTEIHPIYMQADHGCNTVQTAVSSWYCPIFRIPPPPLNQARTTRTATTADCRSPAGQRQPGPAPLSRHPATQQSQPQIRRSIFPDPPGSAAASRPWLACARRRPPAALCTQVAQPISSWAKDYNSHLHHDTGYLVR